MEFRCRLASPNGQIVEGVYSADTEARLRHELEEKGLFVLSLQPKGAIGGLLAYVLFLGVLCFISFLAEGAILDWSAVFLRQVSRADASVAGSVHGSRRVLEHAGRHGRAGCHSVRCYPDGPS